MKIFAPVGRVESECSLPFWPQKTPLFSRGEWLGSKIAYFIPHLHIYSILNSVNNTSLVCSEVYGVEWKRSPKIPFIRWFKAYKNSHWLWKEDLSKPGAHIQKTAAYTNRETNRQRVAEGVVRAVLVRSWKCGPSRISAIVPWSRLSRFDIRALSLESPFAYKYPEIFRSQEEKSF